MKLALPCGTYADSATPSGAFYVAAFEDGDQPHHITECRIETLVRALREERAESQAEQCRVHRVQYVEDLPPRVLKAHRDEWEGS